MLDSFKKTRNKKFDFQDGGSWAKTLMVFAKLIYDFDPLHNKYDGARCPVTKDVISVIMWDT